MEDIYIARGEIFCVKWTIFNFAFVKKTTLKQNIDRYKFAVRSRTKHAYSGVLTRRRKQHDLHSQSESDAIRVKT